MRALVLNGYGGNERLSLAEMPVPEPGPGEVRIRVSHAGLNPLDYKVRNGLLRPIRRLRFPHIMGNEAAGVIDKLGDGVTSFQVGDEVFSRLDKDRMGGFAEWVCDRAEHVAKRPRSIPIEVAAGVPLVALTAWQCLFEVGGLAAGQHALIHGAGGAVGRIALQLAARAGAHVAVTGSTWAEPLVKRLGAERFIDYHTARFEESPGRYHLVLDLVGGDTLDRSFQVVREGGIVISIAGRPEPETAREMGKGAFLAFLFRFYAAKQLRLARRARARYRYVFMHPDGARLADMAARIDRGELEATIDRVFPLADWAEAFALQESGKSRGKIVFAI